jgi:hypothetical protein
MFNNNFSIILLTVPSLKQYLCFKYYNKALYALLAFPYLCYLSVLAHYSYFNSPVNIWLMIQVRKFFIVKISPSSSYFLSLMFTYCHQHPVLPDNLSLD